MFKQLMTVFHVSFIATKKPVDHRAEVQYKQNCERAGLVPVTHFLKEMKQPSVCLSHHGVGTEGILPIAKSLLVNSVVNSKHL